MYSRLLLTLFFMNNKTNKIPQLNPFLAETAVCEFFIAALHHYSCLCNGGITLFWSISLCILLSSARGQNQTVRVDIQRQAEYISSSAAIITNSNGTASYLHSEATMMQIVIHTQHRPLICMLTQQGCLGVAQVVLSFLLSLLINAFDV